MEKLIQFLVPNSNEAYKVLETLRGLADKGEIKLHKVSVVERDGEGKPQMRHVHALKEHKDTNHTKEHKEGSSPVENITDNVKGILSKSVSFLKNTFKVEEKEGEKAAKHENKECGEDCAGREMSNAKECQGKQASECARKEEGEERDFLSSCQESCYGDERMLKMSEKVPAGKTVVFALVDEEWAAPIDSQLGSIAEISRTDIADELKKMSDEYLGKLDEKIKAAKARFSTASEEEMESVKAEYDKLVKKKNSSAEKMRDFLDGKNADGKGWFTKFKDKMKEVGETIAEKAGDMKDAVVDKASDIKDAMSDKAEDAKDAMSDKTRDWQRSVGDKMQDIGKNIKDKGDDMKKIA